MASNDVCIQCYKKVCVYAVYSKDIECGYRRTSPNLVAEPVGPNFALAIFSVRVAYCTDDGRGRERSLRLSDGE